MARRTGVDDFGIVLPKQKKTSRRQAPKPSPAPTPKPTPEPESCSLYAPLPPEPVYGPVPEMPLSREPLALDPIMELITPEVFKDCEFAQALNVVTGVLYHRVASVSITNNRGQPVYDTFVNHKDEKDIIKKLHIAGKKDGKPYAKFGALWSDIKNGQPFEKVCNDLHKIAQRCKILGGHALINDISKFPAWVWKGVATRDIQLFEPYRPPWGLGLARLGDLAKEYLNDDVWKYGHTSVGDARATAALYMLNKEAIDEAQRDGYELENDLPRRKLDPDEYDTEEEAIARLRREQRQEVYWQHQRVIDDAAAAPSSREGITPFRYATDLWSAGIKELKTGLEAADPLEKMATDPFTASNHTRNLSWSSDDTWHSSNGPAVFSTTSQRSSRTSWSSNITSGSSSIDPSTSLVARSLKKLDMNEEDWDGKLLVDDIGTKPVLRFPGGRLLRERVSDPSLPWFIPDAEKIDRAWWLSDSYKRPGRRCECRNGHTWDCSGWADPDLVEAVGREPWNALPGVEVLGEKDWPTVAEAHRRSRN